MNPAALLLSSPVASHSSGSRSLLSKVSSSHPSPCFLPRNDEEGRRCITIPNFITTTTCPVRKAGSSSYLCSPFPRFPIIVRVSEKRELCVVPLLKERIGEVVSFHSLLSLYVRNIILIALVFFIAVPITAQTKQTTHVQQVWTAYFNQTRFSNKWGAWADLHLRTKEDFFTNFSQSIIRLGLTYYLNDDTKLTAGYAWVNHFPADNHKNISQPEHRPWQQIQWHTRFPKLRLMQWFRLEERYRRKILNNDQLASGYNFNFRLRYNFFSQFPLSKKRFQPNTVSFVVNDEVHINFGKQIVNNYFDQNRFFLGFAYHVNKTDNIQFGYMNLFQQLAAGNQYRSIHAARVFYFHNVDLRGGHK